MCTKRGRAWRPLPTALIDPEEKTLTPFETRFPRFDFGSAPRYSYAQIEDEVLA